MSSESVKKWARKHVAKNTVQTKNGEGKGYKCPLPDMYAYPNGTVKLNVLGGGFNIPERMQALLDEFNAEVARREG